MEISNASERSWTNILFAVISSGPVFIVGCTLGFPSAALLDLDFNSIQSDLFGVSTNRSKTSGIGNEIIRVQNVTPSALPSKTD